MAAFRSLALAAAALFVLLAAGQGALSVAQSAGSAKTRAQYVGGFHPAFCRFPKAPRANGVSACCIMDLDIAPDGHVLSADGTCTHPEFLEPTRLCMGAQKFLPAMVNGLPVRALQTLEYEWRATGPHNADLCRKLKVS